jgi:hypothetical protein
MSALPPIATKAGESQQNVALCQGETFRSWFDGMICACATFGEYASFSPKSWC